MCDECVSERNGSALIEQDAHSTQSSRFHEAALGVFEHGLDLLSCDAREPGEEVRYSRASFKILEQRFDWHTRSFEHPGAADSVGNALDNRAPSPIKHEESMPLSARPRKRGAESLARVYRIGSSNGTHREVESRLPAR